MKLASYRTLDSPAGHGATRIAAAWTLGTGLHLIDLQAAHARLRQDAGDVHATAEAKAAARVPAQMLAFLEGGEGAMQAAREGLLHATKTLEAEPQLLARWVADGVLHPITKVHLLAPLPRPGKIIGVGANYRAHVEEGQAAGVLGRIPPYPPAFLKMPSAVIGPDASIVYPSFGSELDYEVELAMVIGAPARDVSVQHALAIVAGYTIINDLGLRDVIAEESQIGVVTSGKNFPTACPMGPFIVTADEIGNPDQLTLQLRVNGERRQFDNTSSMVHRCAAVIAYWSRLGLEPGDVVTTGTPGGSAGFGRRFPERLLRDGDLIEAEIEGIGVLRNRVVGSAA